MIMDFLSKCRLCLKQRGSTDIIELQQDVFSCTGILISNNIKLPQKICNFCLQVVQKAAALRVLANQNNELLELFEDNDSEEDLIVIQVPEPLNSPILKLQGSPFENFQKSVQSLLDSPKTIYHEKFFKSRCKAKPSTSTAEPSITTAKPSISTAKPSISTADLSTSTPLLSPTRVRKRYKKSRNASTSTYDVVTSSQEKPAKQERQEVQEKYDANGTKYFLCLTCKREFDTWKKVYLHQRQHNKRFPCPLDACAKKFADKADLRKHVRTHTGEKPFTCDICAKKFSQNVTLKAHKENIHNLMVC